MEIANKIEFSYKIQMLLLIFSYIWKRISIESMNIVYLFVKPCSFQHDLGHDNATY